MEAFQNINVISLYDSLVSLLTAFILGGVIGLERQYRQRTAGLRTNVLVAVGAAVFVDWGSASKDRKARFMWSPMWCPGLVSCNLDS